MAESQTTWSRDDRATFIYQAVFGSDVIDCVLISAEYGGIVEDHGGLPTNGEVILVLCNGRRVRLWTSEWGGATDADHDV